MEPTKKEKIIQRALENITTTRNNYHYYLNSKNFFIKCSDGYNLSIYFDELDLYNLLGFDKRDVENNLYGYGKEEDKLFYLEKNFYRDCIEEIMKSPDPKINYGNLYYKTRPLSTIKGFNPENLIGVLEFNKSLFNLTGNDLTNPADFYLLMLADNYNLYLMGLEMKSKDKNHLICKPHSIITKFDLNAMFYGQKVSLVTDVSYRNYESEIYSEKFHPVVLDKNIKRLGSISKFFGMHFDSSYYCSNLQNEISAVRVENKNLKNTLQTATAEKETPKSKIKRLWDIIIK